MKLQGSHILSAPRQQVWELLNDPARLAKCLPGCERLEPDGPDRYKAVVKFALSAITGVYSGAIELRDKKPPQSLRIHLEGKGAPGFLNAEGSVELKEKSGRTELRYSGEAQVGGLIAAVGQRLIESAARKIVTQFFESAAKQLQSKPGE